MRDSSNTPVSGVVSYDPDTKTATFVPLFLVGSTSYTVSLLESIESIDGVPCLLTLGASQQKILLLRKWLVFLLLWEQKKLL